MPETQAKEQPSRVVVPMSINDLIYMQLRNIMTADVSGVALGVSYLIFFK